MIHLGSPYAMRACACDVCVRAGESRNSMIVLFGSRPPQVSGLFLEQPQGANPNLAIRFAYPPDTPRIRSNISSWDAAAEGAGTKSGQP